MNLLMSILLLLGGVGVFLAGMSKMSEGLKQSADSGIKGLFNRISNNRFKGYGVGIGSTVLMQSSSATAVMAIGLANARIVDVKQGSSLILGAKVGTTLTAFIFAMSGISTGGFSTGILFSSLAFVGAIWLMIAKKELHKNIATFMLGFGMLFLGLEVMEMAISGEQSAALVNILADMFSVQFFKNPVVLIIIGTIFTFIIQASSAAIAIFMAFLIPSVTGGAAILTVDQAFFLTLGANIGTCSDGLMAAITANTDGKRIAIFHLLTSAIGAIFFSVVIAIFRTPINDLFNNIIVNPKWSLAIFNFSYNLIYTLLLLPLLTPLVKLVSSMVKEKPQKTPKVLEYLNPQILETPALAVIQVKREILSMGKRAANSLQIAYNAIISGDVSQSGVIEEQEEIIDRLNQEISDYLIKLSSLSISMSMEMAIGSYHHVINDIERIGDHAENCMSIALRLANSGEGFSEESAQELKAMHAKVSEALALGLAIFEKNDVRRLPEISAMERDIDAMHKEYSTIHYKRLNGNSNWAEIQIYYDLISELERIGDHVVNIAFSIVNPTGTESSVIPSAKPAKEIKR